MNDCWVEISCDVPAAFADTVAEFLAELSGNGVCTANMNVDAFSHSEIIHPAITKVSAYFASMEELDAGKLQIRSFLEALAAESPEFTFKEPNISTVRSEDWSTSWQANFKPLRIGEHLLIVPSWEYLQPLPGDIVLRIDPGMAFGTGGHETTRLCLELLEQIMTGMHHAAPPSVLDLGTGSGILAMAAARLGARRVCAVDIDPIAIDVASHNIAANDMAQLIETATTPLETLTDCFDIILANILAEELVRLSSHLIDRLAPEGTLVLSGILSEKEYLVRDGFASSSLEYQTTRQQGEWVALIYRKGDAP
jgi:ribosomal protein L11 methyltransferase